MQIFASPPRWYSPVWNTHSPATLFPSAPKLIPRQAVPSASSSTASVMFSPLCGAMITGGAGPPFGSPLATRESEGRKPFGVSEEAMVLGELACKWWFSRPLPPRTSLLGIRVKRKRRRKRRTQSSCGETKEPLGFSLDPGGVPPPLILMPWTLIP